IINSVDGKGSDETLSVEELLHNFGTFQAKKTTSFYRNLDKNGYVKPPSELKITLDLSLRTNFLTNIGIGLFLMGESSIKFQKRIIFS
ncbi:hypothetical protein Lal_00046046, partial [Lupinus albus]